MAGRTFRSVQETKEFIAAEIAGQAQRDGTPLSEIERKMLLYSEAGWAPPDIVEVSDAFDRHYDPTQYEKKISAIIKQLDKRLRKESPAQYDDWRSGLKYLKRKNYDEDIMNIFVARANLRPPWDRVKLVATALFAAVALVCWFFISQKYGFDKYFPENLSKYVGLIIYVAAILLAALSVAISYVYYLFKTNRTPHFLHKILTKLFDESPAPEDR